MRALLIPLVWALQVACADAQAPPASSGPVRNPLVDPFAAAAKAEAVRVATPTPKSSATTVASATTSATPPVHATLPAGLRVLLIRENAMGLLNTGEPGSHSIPVRSGSVLRLLEQDFHVEVAPSSIRLYASSGRLVWEGYLAGESAPTVPADTSQIRYIPPLSAGTDPGLGGTNYRAANPLITKTGEAH